MDESDKIVGIQWSEGILPEPMGFAKLVEILFILLDDSIDWRKGGGLACAWAGALTHWNLHRIGL